MPENVTCPLRATRDRIIVRALGASERTTDPGTKLVLPGGADSFERGRVVAVGPGRVTLDGSVIGVAVVVGETVVYDKASGKMVRAGGVNYTVLPEEAIVAVEGY